MPSIDLKDQYFGCEIEMTGLTRQQAAEAVASLFGTNAVHSRSSRTYDPWEVTDNEGKTWRFVYDSSIHGSHRTGRQQVPIGDGDYKVEMNSPKLEYSEMGKLQEVVRTLRHAGAVVNGSCGMHVHVDASKHTPQSLKNALSIMYSKEDILFKALNVNESRVERWCQKVREPMLEKIRKLPSNTTMDRLRREWYEGCLLYTSLPRLKFQAGCGMHVHVDASKHTPQSLKNALSIMYSNCLLYTSRCV